MKNDEQLLDMFQKVISGLESKENLCDLIEDQVFALVKPVMKTEKKKDEVSVQILVEICKSIEEFNLEKNIRRQIASFTSVYLYNYLLEQGTEIQTKGNLLEYDYTSVKEDQELHSAVKRMVKVFRDAKMYKKADKHFKKMSPMDVVLIELFAYETYSIDQLEDMLELDSVFLCNAIQRAKCAFLGIGIEEDDVEREDSYIDAFDGVDESDVEDANQDDVDEIEEVDGDFLEDIHATSSRKKKSVTYIRPEDQPNAWEKSAGMISKVFPKLDKKYVTMIQCGIIAVVFVLVVALGSCAVKGISSSKKKDQSPTKVETTAAEQTTEQATTKKNSTTAAPYVYTQPAGVQDNQGQNTNKETQVEETVQEETTAEETTAEITDGTNEGNTENVTEGSSDGAEESTSATEEATSGADNTTQSTESTSSSDAGSANPPVGDSGAGGSSDTGAGDAGAGGVANLGV